MSEWISFNEMRPKYDVDVLVYCADTEECFVAYARNDGTFHYATYQSVNAIVDIVCQPTHWMPLPEPPTE